MTYLQSYKRINNEADVKKLQAAEYTAFEWYVNY
jgi:hypothetical protein